MSGCGVVPMTARLGGAEDSLMDKKSYPPARCSFKHWVTGLATDAKSVAGYNGRWVASHAEGT
jgi:hypothetical protein